MPKGYTNPLYILAFDHRGSFMKKMFGIDGRQPTVEETAEIASYKKIIFEGFKKAIANGVPKDQAAILIDEQFGDAIIAEAVGDALTVCIPVEKSGQDEFDFEYDQDFAQHINKYRPKIVKVLIRYNPDDDPQMNQRQAQRLKTLSDFCQQNNYFFLIESLVPATTQQLASVDNIADRYENEIRPELMVRMVAELQATGVEPDIWKIEGLNETAAYEKIVAQMRSGGRDNVAAVVLGRGANAAQVEQWLNAGKSVNGIIGFAIGRTIFWDPLAQYKAKEIDASVAAEKIGQNYLHFYTIFTAR